VLPLLTVGRGHPELVLYGVTAGGALLFISEEARRGESGLLRLDVGGLLDLDAEMVQRSAGALVLEKHQLQRWLSDRDMKQSFQSHRKLSMQDTCLLNPQLSI
jgi:hypothetical protein